MIVYEAAGRWLAICISFVVVVMVQVARLLTSYLLNSSGTKALRNFKYSLNLCKMSTYTTVEKGTPNSVDYRIFYSECFVSCSNLDSLFILVINPMIFIESWEYKLKKDLNHPNYQYLVQKYLPGNYFPDKIQFAYVTAIDQKLSPIILIAASHFHHSRGCQRYPNLANARHSIVRQHGKDCLQHGRGDSPVDKRQDGSEFCLSNHIANDHHVALVYNLKRPPARFIWW